MRLLTTLMLALVFEIVLGQRYYGRLNREFRDSYGYYRYIGGQRVYSECHNSRLDPVRDRCRRVNGYYLRTGLDPIVNDDAYDGVQGEGYYRTYGYLRFASSSRRYPSRSYYNARNSIYGRDRDDECPYANFETSRSRLGYNRFGYGSSSALNVRYGRSIFSSGKNKTIPDNNVKSEWYEEKAADANINTRKSFNSTRQGRWARYYDSNYYGGRSGGLYNNVAGYPDRGSCTNRLEQEMCVWEAKLSCDFDSYDHIPYSDEILDPVETLLPADNNVIVDDDDAAVIVDRRRNFYRRGYSRSRYRTRTLGRTLGRSSSYRIKWSRIYDAHYPRDKFRDIFDYFGKRARLINDGNTLVIEKVYPEDKGVYVCELDTGEPSYSESRRFRDFYRTRGRTSGYGRTIIRKEVRFFPMYPCD